MSIVSLIVLLVLIGAGLGLLNTVAGIDAKVKTIINVVVVLAALLLVAHVFGLIDDTHLGVVGHYRRC